MECSQGKRFSRWGAHLLRPGLRPSGQRGGDEGSTSDVSCNCPSSAAGGGRTASSCLRDAIGGPGA